MAFAKWRAQYNLVDPPPRNGIDGSLKIITFEIRKAVQRHIQRIVWYSFNAKRVSVGVVRLDRVCRRFCYLVAENVCAVPAVERIV